jgi:hypothetical protein
MPEKTKTSVKKLEFLPRISSDSSCLEKSRLNGGVFEWFKDYHQRARDSVIKKWTPKRTSFRPSSRFQCLDASMEDTELFPDISCTEPLEYNSRLRDLALTSAKEWANIDDPNAPLTYPSPEGRGNTRFSPEELLPPTRRPRWPGPSSHYGMTRVPLGKQGMPKDGILAPPALVMSVGDGGLKARTVTASPAGLVVGGSIINQAFRKIVERLPGIAAAFDEESVLDMKSLEDIEMMFVSKRSTNQQQKHGTRPVSTKRDQVLGVSADLSEASDRIPFHFAKAITDGVADACGWDPSIRAIMDAMTQQQQLDYADAPEDWNTSRYFSQRGVLMGLPLAWHILCFCNYLSTPEQLRTESKVAICGDDLFMLATSAEEEAYSSTIENRFRLKISRKKHFVSPDGGIFTEKYFTLEKEQVSGKGAKFLYAKELRTKYRLLHPGPKTRQHLQSESIYITAMLSKRFPSLSNSGARTIAQRIDAPGVLSTIKLRELGRIKTSQLTRAKLGKKGTEGVVAGWLALPDISDEISRTPKVPLWSRRKALSCLYNHHRSDIEKLRRAGIHPFLPKWAGGAGCIPHGTRRLTDLTLKERKRVAILAATKDSEGLATQAIQSFVGKYQYCWGVVDKTKASQKAHRLAKRLTDVVKTSGPPSQGGYDSFEFYTEAKVLLTALQGRDPGEDRSPSRNTIRPGALGRKFAKFDIAIRKLRPYINPMSLKKIAVLPLNPPEKSKRYVLNSSRELLLKEIERAFTFRQDGGESVPKWVTTILSTSGEWEGQLQDLHPRVVPTNI